MVEKAETIDVARFTQHVQEIRDIIAADGVQAPLLVVLPFELFKAKRRNPTRNNGTVY